MIWRRLRKFMEIVVDPFFLSALLKGSAAGVEHKPVLSNFHFDYIVDVGANRGQFALITRKLYPSARILSFEPLEEAIKVFRRVFSSDPNTILYDCAIGSENTTSIIHITKDDDSSSLLPITNTQTRIFPGAYEKSTRQVSVITLDQILDENFPSSSLLKIDVQGYELAVLQGCESIIDKFYMLYIECSFMELYKNQAQAAQIISWLEARSFFLSGVHNMSYDKTGRAVQGDFLFTKR